MTGWPSVLAESFNRKVHQIYLKISILAFGEAQKSTVLYESWFREGTEDDALSN